MWINIETKRVYRLHGEIRAALEKSETPITLPSIITDEVLAEVGVVPVVTTTLEYNRITHEQVELAPQETEGVWYQALENVARPVEQATELLKQAQEQAWEAIKLQRGVQNFGGVYAKDHWFHSDIDSRIKWLGLKDTARDMLAAGATMTDRVYENDSALVWKTMEGTWAAVTLDLVFEVVQAIKTLDAKVHLAAEVLKSSMLTMADPSKLSVTSGWPETYEEFARKGVNE